MQTKEIFLENFDNPLLKYIYKNCYRKLASNCHGLIFASYNYILREQQGFSIPTITSSRMLPRTEKFVDMQRAEILLKLYTREIEPNLALEISQQTSGFVTCHFRNPNKLYGKVEHLNILEHSAILNPLNLSCDNNFQNLQILHRPNTDCYIEFRNYGEVYDYYFKYFGNHSPIIEFRTYQENFIGIEA